jgi:uncharacterized protein YdeI (YjbR/CyaY-like superfamily)
MLNSGPRAFIGKPFSKKCFPAGDAESKHSIDWPQSVDQALCFGSIDGVRKRIDDLSYQIRFTPRNPKSHWCQVNIKKAEGLIKKS